MPLLVWIVLFTLLGGALSALAASLFLVAPESLRARVLPHLVSFATGALLGAALLGLLPHASPTQADIEDALKRFQKANGLTDTGSVDDATRTKLREKHQA